VSDYEPWTESAEPYEPAVPDELYPSHSTDGMDDYDAFSVGNFDQERG
jgi:hypothetical protein